MKRLFTSRILACLIFLTIWGSKTYAQGSTSSIDAGTETFKITSNTRINSQKTEYQYYASANISLFIGADEVWKNEQISSGKYYLSSGGNMGIRQDEDPTKQTDAGYYKAERTTGISACIALPNTGNYFHFLFHTKGNIKLAFNVKYRDNATDPTKLNQKDLYVEKATNETVTVVDKNKKNNYTTRRGITPSSIKVTTTETGTKIDPQESDDNKYFKIRAVGGDHPMVIEFDAEAGDEYCIWMSSAEEFALGGFTFDVDKSQLFTPWKPVVHRQIEIDKSPKVMEKEDANAPSGVEDITFMYGGWTNHTNAVKAATWNDTEKTWGFNENGTANTTYTINNEQKIDKWETVKAESETTEKLVTLDGYGKFTAGCEQVPTDQYGKTYTPATSTAPSVANIPCRGTYYKFEPAKDGTLNVYVRQAANNSPLYLVDETGKPQESIDYKAGNDAKFTKGSDASYTIDKLAACRYGFNVKAGKTYVLFQNNETLGFYGFTFGASSTEISDVTISQADGYTYEAKNNATVTLTKPLKKDVWNAICLPFSMTEQQVRNAFGEDARIAEFKKVDESGKKALFGMHYYQLITAGKPCLIKPSKVSDKDNYTITGVTIDAEKALTVADSNKKFDFVGTYATTSMPVNSHFLGSNDGKLYYITTAKNISGLKAFLKPAENNSGAKLSIAFGSTDYDLDNNTTGIEAIKDYTDQDAANSSANKGIYNINGQFMGTNPAILPQGIYVKNGKKFIVK